MLASQALGVSGGSAAWAALASVATVVVVLGAAAVKMISTFTGMVASIDRLNKSIEVIVAQVGHHEHRISMLEGSEHTRTVREDAGRHGP